MLVALLFRGVMKGFQNHHAHGIGVLVRIGVEQIDVLEKGGENHRIGAEGRPHRLAFALFDGPDHPGNPLRDRVGGLRLGRHARARHLRCRCVDEADRPVILARLRSRARPRVGARFAVIHSGGRGSFVGGSVYA